MVVQFSDSVFCRSAVVAAALMMAFLNTTHAQYYRRSVGGVSIDAEGVLNNATTDAVGELHKARVKAMEEIPGDLNKAVGLRKVSLRRLEAAIQERIASGKPLSDSIKYLAGLQQIQYVFVFPERRDIILAGPAEGWKVDPRGNIVGCTTQHPIMLLDNLLVALRAAHAMPRPEITCSIDPTPEGMARTSKLVAAKDTDPIAFGREWEKAMGMQTITVAGVPTTSYFARVLVAADYRMKRISMSLDDSPVSGLPSYLDMVKPGRKIQTPRFWLEPKYEAVLRDADGLVFEFRGPSVKAMTEEDFVTSTGNMQHSGKASSAAQGWANRMTQKYPKLAVADPIFGELRNCMELAVVAALIVKEELTVKAGYSMSLLLDAKDMKTEEFPAPTKVESKASAITKGRKWIISVSGGVRINPWTLVEKIETKQTLGEVRSQVAGKESQKWWWD